MTIEIIIRIVGILLILYSGSTLIFSKQMSGNKKITMTVIFTSSILTLLFLTSLTFLTCFSL
jgi:hypothetical protein